MRRLVGNVGIAVARAMIRLPPIIALPLLRESIENVKRFAISSSIKFTVSRKNQWKRWIEKRWDWKNLGMEFRVGRIGDVFCDKSSRAEIEGTATRPRSFLPPLTLLPFPNLVETARPPCRRN